MKAIWPWVHALYVNYDSKVIVEEFNHMRAFPRVRGWYNRVFNRPAVKKALEVTPFFS